MGDKFVQQSVEGRFCDTAISVREAALELVGRHIASHPDVGFKVCVNGFFLNCKKQICSCLANFMAVTETLTLRVVGLLKQTFKFVLQYFEKVTERIKDTGVSVRKRAIKIIRDMCCSDANFSGFTRACTEIISRVTDDESSIQVL